MEKYICLHGHFYQPPRENPWLEAIELQDSAYPYHDWNERVNAECYAPNARCRILDDTGKIVRIVNNYGRISFNVGPTLLSWLEEKAPETYREILEADRDSRERFSGHGSAIAQAYNHLIMPLANERDKRTQVIWGLRDFEARFGRKPEGMWLPETAVDVASLEILAENGIAFTILAPHQAKRIRKTGAHDWSEFHAGGIDPTRAYWIRLPSGRSIAAFFYDGPISRAIAFERLLDKGETLVNRLMGGFADGRDWPQLVHVATDGETYGHHHRYGDMALAYALSQIDVSATVKLTNYAEYLERCPPTHEIEIAENSSWSCAHGVERWRSDCGCNSGNRPGWNQAWRAPLRGALDWLRDAVAPLYESAAREFFDDPWDARNEYVRVLLDRSPERIEEFLARARKPDLTGPERSRILKLLELQRQALLMYTSCGWFFNDISGIETVQVIQYAGRAIQLVEDLFQQPFEEPFLQRLDAAKSNLPEFGDGRGVYNRFVRSSAMDLAKVGAHYAISALFANGMDDAKTYCYTIDYEDFKTFAAGKARLVAGRIRVMSEVTLESESFLFGILHLGDHNLNGGVRVLADATSYEKMIADLTASFKKADFSETIRAMDRHFGGSTYSLKSLFRDEQRKIVTSILESTLVDAESLLRQIFENNAPLLRFLADLSVPLPKALKAAAEFSLNLNLRNALESDDFDIDRVGALLTEARETGITLDGPGLGFALEKHLAHIMEDLWSDPEDAVALVMVLDAVRVVRILPFEVNLWGLQNNYYELVQGVLPRMKERVVHGDDSARTWIQAFYELGDQLYVKIR